MNFSRVRLFAFLGLLVILALQVVSATTTATTTVTATVTGPATTTATKGAVATATVAADKKKDGKIKKSKDGNAAFSLEPSVFALFLAGVGAVMALL
jgi:hypothetical protein